MQTHFSGAQLEEPATASSEQIIRKCVHCGFCIATCPTYVLLGDELDSPRGRIYLIKDMLENERQPTAETVTHIDRCLSCLSCMSTCPSGVNYMHLVDHARSYIEDRYRRPFADRMMRGLLAAVLPYPGRFRAALTLAPLGRAFAPLFRKISALQPLAAMLDLAPHGVFRRTPPSLESLAGVKTARRVLMLKGCAEPILAPHIQEAAVRLLRRCGISVDYAPAAGCCGALVHHMGKEAEALDFARRNIDAWMKCLDGQDYEAIAVTVSGCGTSLKNYGFMLRDDPAYAEKAARISALARDISELLNPEDLPPPVIEAGLTVAYHAACSLQHGQQLRIGPKRLLIAMGFKVSEPLDPHLCCGSAGTYNILQPEIAGQLRDRKVTTLERLRTDVVAAGNIGCLMQIGSAAKVPVVHTIELLDWATGGPRPFS